ncbi:hypothetical protein DMENIID0001_162120 [Sergentomyia squamirostris]
MEFRLALLTTLVCLVASLSSAEGGKGKKVKIHLPVHVKHHKHTHTIVKNIHHYHKPTLIKEEKFLKAEASSPLSKEDIEHEHFHHHYKHDHPVIELESNENPIRLGDINTNPIRIEIPEKPVRFGGSRDRPFRYGSSSLEKPFRYSHSGSQEKPLRYQATSLEKPLRLKATSLEKPLRYQATSLEKPIRYGLPKSKPIRFGLSSDEDFDTESTEDFFEKARKELEKKFNKKNYHHEARFYGNSKSALRKSWPFD